jgi:hypothetical protein
MYATLRWYGGNVDLADHLAARSDDVKAVINGVSGARAYYLIRTDGGTVSVTIADDEDAAQETNTAAANWLMENLPEVAADPPQISMGDVVVSL